MSRAIQLTQAQRACVMQPRVRRTLGIESPHASISPNPNGVPYLAATSWLLVGIGNQPHRTKVPAATSRGFSTLTCGNLLKSSPLNDNKCSTPWADMTAAMRASCAFLPFTSCVLTRLRQIGRMAFRSPSIPNREVSASISISVREVVHPRPFFSVGRVATAQNSINTWGVSLIRCPLAIRLCTAAFTKVWLGDVVSANRRQMFVSKSTRAIGKISPRRCRRDSPPNQKVLCRPHDSPPTLGNQRLVPQRSCVSTQDLMRPLHPLHLHHLIARRRLAAEALPLLPLAMADPAAAAAATPWFRSVRSLCS